MDLNVNLVLFLALCLFFSNNASDVKFTNYVCHNNNESFITVHECRLRAISRNKTTLNFNGTLLHPVHSMRLAVRLFKRENGWKPWLYKFELDVCQFLAKPYHPIAILMMKAMRKFSNLNHTCPYVGPIIGKGIHIEYQQLQVPMPSGDFLIEFDWIQNNKIQIYTNVYVKVVETI